MSAVQFVFQQLTAEYPSQNMEDKEAMLNGILFFANELFSPDTPYGYKEFDLVLSRAFPTSETLCFIENQEGKNVFQGGTDE